MESKSEAVQLLEKAAETLGVTYRDMLSSIARGEIPTRQYDHRFIFKKSDLKKFVAKELKKTWRKKCAPRKTQISKRKIL